MISKIMLANSVVCIGFIMECFLPNFYDLLKNLPLLMGLRNVETWILQFTNFLYDVIAPDFTVYILEQHALNACFLLW